jgi:type VI secretion system protein ImpF
VLDRLIDEDPRATADPPTTLAESIRKVKSAVLRDLEWLLNSRRNPERVPESCVEVRRSVYYYGLPDTTSLSRDDPAVRRRLQRELEECLRIFEPRLEAVEIQLVEVKGPLLQLRFIVDAILRMDPDPERIRFDTVLDVSSGRISVGDS